MMIGFPLVSFDSINMQCMVGLTLSNRFANEEALTEIHRVLKPGGKVGMIWNIEDCMYSQPYMVRVTD